MPFQSSRHRGGHKFSATNSCPFLITAPASAVGGAWAAPDGMLGGNGILTEEQTKQVLVWVDLMEGCLMYLLDGDVEDAFCDYEDYRNGEYL